MSFTKLFRSSSRNGSHRKPTVVTNNLFILECIQFSFLWIVLFKVYRLAQCFPLTILNRDVMCFGCPIVSSSGLYPYCCRNMVDICSVPYISYGTVDSVPLCAVTWAAACAIVIDFVFNLFVDFAFELLNCWKARRAHNIKTCLPYMLMQNSKNLDEYSLVDETEGYSMMVVFV